ncbi:DoxX family protein [Candidatus Parvarchaeota archaeon]|nr:DoxX family protein [Candidatus Parvarchaeota archaeon]
MQRGEKTENLDLALLLLRLVFVAFMLHGVQKFMDLGATAGFFGKVGIPAPDIMALVVAAVETFGSLAMILGIGTRFAGPLLAFVMVVAIFTVKLSGALAKGLPFGLIGMEIDLAYLFASLALTFSGPGKHSLEAMMKK